MLEWLIINTGIIVYVCIMYIDLMDRLNVADKYTQNFHCFFSLREFPFLDQIKVSLMSSNYVLMLLFPVFCRPVIILISSWGSMELDSLT